jgi:hypothetical protein
MPCHTATRITTEFKADQLNLLRAALEAEGYSVTLDAQAKRLSFNNAEGYGGTFRDGKMNTTSGTDLDAIRLGYSKALVKEAARRAGFQFAPKSRTAATVSRRY